MFREAQVVKYAALAVLFYSLALSGQQKPAPPSNPGAREFPVTMRQNLTAGTTLVGTKVQAKLTIATLVNGKVVPRDAILEGVVTESVGKSGSDPSRLAVRMDEVRWKKQSLPIKVYLTAWYYPSEELSTQNLNYQPPDAARSPKNWNGAGPYPDPNSPAAQPFPGRETDHQQDPSPMATPASNVSKHRVLMPNVESARGSEGDVALISKRSNIKIDKVTTYVLAADGLVPGN
jgi:hypothetical protein